MYNKQEEKKTKQQQQLRQQNEIKITKRNSDSIDATHANGNLCEYEMLYAKYREYKMEQNNTKKIYCRGSQTINRKQKILHFNLLL